MWFSSKEGVLQDKRISELRSLKHFVSTKLSGNMLCETEREALFDSLNIDSKKLVTAKQVHGSNVYIVKETDCGQKIENTDCLITEARDIPLGIYTADCVPVFLTDCNTAKVGIVHAGWRGIAGNIIETSIKKFVKLKNGTEKTVVVSVGPHICPECYNVGDEIGRLFTKDNYKEGKLNLAAEIKNRLLNSGITDKNTIVSEYCTYHQPEMFFSYRRGDKQSRIISVIMIKS